MLKAVNWCLKCLFIYLIVAILAMKFAGLFILPVWNIATRLHWTTQNRLVFSLNYFLPIFAAVGFLIGLIPFHRITRSVPSFGSSDSAEQPTWFDQTPAILWAWLPVTIAFLVRYFTWSSRNSSVIDPHAITTGRFVRFFGTLNMQNASLFDPKWGFDRIYFTGPMLFLMACALAVYLRQRLTGQKRVTSSTEPPSGQA
jgi:hypothetical protein